MSRFQMPEYLESYLNTRYNAPVNGWVNFSNYYANLSPYFINYMNTVIRQDVALATASSDGIGSHLSMNVGYAIKKAAVQLIKGNSLIFNGDDKATAFLSDIWSKKTKFKRTIAEAVDYTVTGGTSALKTDIDGRGRTSLSSFRVDRYYANTDSRGNVIEALFLLNMLSSQKSENSLCQYWLVEHRFYKDGKPYVIFKVHTNGGVAGSEPLPLMFGAGLPKRALSSNLLRIVASMGIELNIPMELPFKEGLGVRLLVNTDTNSVVPGLNMGDPMLYGAEDLLWSLDTVFCGSVIDVLNGEGKVLAPKKFLTEVRELLNSHGFSVTDQRAEAWGENDDGLTYVSVEHDKDFPPMSVQFEIRAEKYVAVFEWYLREIVAHTGFSPTSIFPFLSDNSAKTATEVNAEENKTRATVESWHNTNLPEINNALEEVLYLEGFKGKATLQLSDYIGNKLQADQNLRENYRAGAVPRDVFVKKINGLTDKETDEYLAKIDEDQKMAAEMQKSSVFGGLTDIGV